MVRTNETCQKHLRRKARFIDFCPIEFVHELYNYFLKRDLDDDSNKAPLFYELYISSSKLTHEDIAHNHGIEVGTLRNFVKKANNFAKKLSDKRQRDSA